MAALTENRLKEEIKLKDFRSLYVLVGEDPFKPEHYSDGIFRALFPSGQGSKTLLFGDEIQPQALLDDAKNLSLWDPQKFILVKQAERISSKNWEGLLPLLKEPLEKCTVVFQAAKVDARFKFFQSLNKAGSHCGLLKFETADSSDWNFWLGNFLRIQQKEMEDDAKQLLADWTLGHLSELKNLVERVSIYIGEQKKIRKEDVVAVGFRVAPEDVFAFTENLLKGDRSKSLELLEKLLDQGEEPLALIGLMARQFRWLLHILTLRAEGKTDAQIPSVAGIFPSAAKILVPASRRMGGKKVIAGLNCLAEVDFQLKSSRVPNRLWLSDLVIQLT
jgi:DNA polymerase III subunit delta